MRLPFLPFVVLALCASLSGCVNYEDGVHAYEAGDHQKAYDIFDAVASAEGEAARPELLHHLALSALRIGDADAAEAASRAAAVHGDDYALLRDLVRGHIAWLRCDLAAEQARQVQAEPFAFELAIRHADEAREAWGRAAGLLVDDEERLAASRNAERAWLRAEALRKERDEAAKGRKTQKAGGGPPKVNLVQQPPQQTDEQGETGDPPQDGGTGDDGSTEPGLALTEGELPADRVMAVLDTLRAKQDEKLAARRARRRARSSDVERDW